MTTAAQRRARASAQAAIARAQAHTRHPVDDQDEHYPVTPAVARALREAIDTERSATADDWWPTPAQEPTDAH